MVKQGLKYILKLCFYLVILDKGLCEIMDEEKVLHRDKRFLLVYPFGGTFKIVISVGLPVMLGIKQSMAIGWNLQWQYPCATNITQLEQSYPPVVGRHSREKRDNRPSDRLLAYRGFENILDRHGINGQECLLRSICENAVQSTFHEANGLYGKLIHIALTPDYGDGEIEPDLDAVYTDAQRAGEYGVDCRTLYPDCHYEGNRGLLDVISILDK
ncbi:unnamed protein product [Brassicogethes aeneus]|uniref:Uncharacterized protein n=1 Tax=Brassicogethes aeneus TaxID=1431903 RepID=A0A9P0AZ54_BRAAE|nr:unnamed protein product [Brassicogethes aeneus]